MVQQVYQISSTQYGNLITVRVPNAVPPDDEFKFSDHGREPLNIVTDRIEITRRTAKGNRRRYLVSDKVSFSVSWTNLPGQSTQTVDGNRGAEELERLFKLADAEDEVFVDIVEQDLTTTTYSMHITGFDKVVNKRFSTGYYYNVTMSFEEI